ncbi:MAG TPA: hypothetical protein VGJ54_01750 [Streptosporangiaceae bacterium]
MDGARGTAGLGDQPASPALGRRCAAPLGLGLRLGRFGHGCFFRELGRDRGKFVGVRVVKPPNGVPRPGCAGRLGGVLGLGGAGRLGGVLGLDRAGGRPEGLLRLGRAARPRAGILALGRVRGRPKDLLRLSSVARPRASVLTLGRAGGRPGSILALGRLAGRAAGLLRLSPVGCARFLRDVEAERRRPPVLGAAIAILALDDDRA